MKVLSILLLLFAFTARAAEPEGSVVRIQVFSQQPDWSLPWNMAPVRRGSGTGFVIDGNRIVTNAHVVSWARQIVVHKFQDPRPYLARVAFIGHDCDLAVLRVEDESFFDYMEPLPLGELPEVRSTVVTIGYPAGGEQISYTQGVVSRIELQPFTHIGNRQFLAAQTDAAINPGNSGGPVIQGGKVVGVAFQGIPGLENTGFFIAPQVVNHFLEDCEDGNYDGFPQAGIRIASLQNPAQRAYLKLPPTGGGARIDSLVSAPAREHLREDDVLLKAGEYPVASDATILFERNQLHAGLAFSQAQHGEEVPVKIWRDGAEVDINLPVNVITYDRAEGSQYEMPRYFVYAGLVFTPLSRDYLSSFGRDWSNTTGIDVLYELYYRRTASPESVRAEPIMLASILAHPVNANMEVRGPALVDEINGQRIERLEDVISAFQSQEEKHHLIDFPGNLGFECLDRAEAESVNQEILTTYGILEDRKL